VRPGRGVGSGHDGQDLGSTGLGGDDCMHVVANVGAVEFHPASSDDHGRAPRMCVH